MKKLPILCLLVMMFTVGSAKAQQYEVAPCGTKNFTTAAAVIPDATICLDIWLTGANAPQNAGGAWLDFSNSVADIAYVSGGRCLADGSEGCTAPWDPAGGALVNEPAGVGTVMYVVSASAAAPDGDGDLIVGTVILQYTGPNDATVNITTIPGVATWTPIFDSDVIPGSIVISQILGDEDEDGIQDGQDNCPIMPNGPLLGTCINIYNGAAGTTCLNDGECGTGENCSNDQEDRDNNGSGDACDTGTFCRGLADYDADVDANDVTVFLSHFGRSQFNNPCPIEGPTPVPKTGQTTSYATGDDGDLQRGVALVSPRFTDNGNGTVTDNQTGLMWLKNADCFGQKTWDVALTDCSGLASGSCGLTDGSSTGDWRLPQRFELESLLNLEYYNPALSNTLGTGQWSEGDPFNNLYSSGYWSATTKASDTSYSWVIGMNDGVVGYGSKSVTAHIWPVRGGH